MRPIDADTAQSIADNELLVDERGVVQFVLSHTPTIEAESVRHGRWVYDRLDTEKEPYKYPMEGPVQMYRPWMCSACGVHKEHRENYCPNCGAKMDMEKSK